ncbi:hypothetical protein WAI453_013163 [Rhynchosporium graminicola]
MIVATSIFLALETSVGRNQDVFEISYTLGARLLDIHQDSAKEKLSEAKTTSIQTEDPEARLCCPNSRKPDDMPFLSSH